MMEVFIIFIYKFKAVNSNNEVIKNIVFAKSDEDFKSLLIKEKLFLISYKKKKKVDKINNYKIKTIEIINFFNKLIILINSGINIIDAIENIINTSTNEKFKRILVNIKQELLKGKKISECLKLYPRCFVKMVINLVEVSEETGDLIGGFRNIIIYLEKEKKMKDKISSALFYPIILLILTFIIVMAMFLIILPMYREMFLNLNIKIPVFTSFLFNLSDYIKKNILFIMLSIISLLIILFLILRTKKVKNFIDKIKYKTFKELMSLRIGSLFCKIIYMLNKSGMPFIDSLEITINNINNDFVQKRLSNCLIDVKKGVNIANAFKKTNIFPSMLIEMLSVVNNGGYLLDVLEINYLYYDEELEKRLNKLITLIEPIMIILISSIIVVIMISIFIPMFSLMDNIGGM